MAPAAAVLSSSPGGWSAFGQKDVEEKMVCGQLLSSSQQAQLDMALRERAKSEPGSEAPAVGATSHAVSGDGDVKKKGRGVNGGRGRGARKAREMQLAVERLPNKVLKGKMRKGSPLYSWGSRGLLHDAIALDRKDPNYESDEEDDDPRAYYVDARAADGEDEDSTKKIKQFMHVIMAEYWLSGVVDEVAIDLTAIDSSVMNAIFVKKSITLSLDRGAREKEMTSNLLSYLYGEVLSPQEIRRGFRDLLSSADDVLIDVPGCIEDLAKFTARAACDDILSPSFICDLQAEYCNTGGAGTASSGSTSAAGEIMERTASLLSSRHRAERLQRCWGTGDSCAVDEVRRAIDRMIAEYLTSSDAEEACVCLRELHKPFFHHETVKRLITTVLGAADEELERTRDAVSRLLSIFASRHLVSATQMLKGFMRVSDNIDDITLDMPFAAERFKEMRGVAAEEKWLE